MYQTKDSLYGRAPMRDMHQEGNPVLVQCCVQPGTSSILVYTIQDHRVEREHSLLQCCSCSEKSRGGAARLLSAKRPPLRAIVIAALPGTSPDGPPRTLRRTSIRRLVPTSRTTACPSSLPAPPEVLHIHLWGRPPARLRCLFLYITPEGGHPEATAAVF